MKKSIIIWILIAFFSWIAVVSIVFFVKQQKQKNSPQTNLPQLSFTFPTTNPTTALVDKRFGGFVSPSPLSAQAASTSAFALVDKLNSVVNFTHWSILFEPVSTAGRVEIFKGKLFTQGKKPDNKESWTFTGVVGKNKLTGDFTMDVQIDDFLTDQIGSGSAEMQFCNQRCTVGIYLYWKKDKNNEQYLSLVSLLADEGVKKANKVKLSADIGQVKLRLIRTGAVAVAYQHDGKQYKLISKLENVYDGPGFARLGTVIWGYSLPKIQAYFSNFSLKGTELK